MNSKDHQRLEIENATTSTVYQDILEEGIINQPICPITQAIFLNGALSAFSTINAPISSSSSKLSLAHSNSSSDI